jgi:hypothetical protein
MQRKQLEVDHRLALKLKRDFFKRQVIATPNNSGVDFAAEYRRKNGNLFKAKEHLTVDSIIKKYQTDFLEDSVALTKQSFVSQMQAEKGKNRRLENKLKMFNMASVNKNKTKALTSSSHSSLGKNFGFGLLHGKTDLDSHWTPDIDGSGSAINAVLPTYFTAINYQPSDVTKELSSEQMQEKKNNVFDVNGGIKHRKRSADVPSSARGSIASKEVARSTRASIITDRRVSSAQGAAAKNSMVSTSNSPHTQE